MKKHNGFTFIELIGSMFIITLLSSIFVPIVTKIYVEKSTISEQLQAMDILTDLFQEWLYDGKELPANETTITLNGVSYKVKKQTTFAEEIEVCLHWYGRNEREYIRCGYGKK